jgi:hypothetical protein
VAKGSTLQAIIEFDAIGNQCSDAALETRTDRLFDRIGRASC